MFYFLKYGITLFLLISFTSCQSLEYETDRIEIEGNSIYCKNVGFSGYRLRSPEGYRLLQNPDLENLDSKHKLFVDKLLSINSLSEGGGVYHFHQAFFFIKDDSIFYFYPLQLKYIHKFHGVPLDYKIAYMKRFLRYSRRSDTVLNPQNSFGVDIDEVDRNAIGWIQYDDSQSLYSRKEVYITGKLNEIYLLGFYCIKEGRKSVEADFVNFMNYLVVL